MSSSYFVFESQETTHPTRIVMSVDLAGLSAFLEQLASLYNGKIERFCISEVDGFRGLNLSDIIFLKTGNSRIDFDGFRLWMQVDQSNVSKFIQLAERLLESQSGHQYLDTLDANMDVELVLSIGEYPANYSLSRTW